MHKRGCSEGVRGTRSRKSGWMVPSWRITEGQYGSLGWVFPKTRPSHRVLPSKSALGRIYPASIRSPPFPSMQVANIGGEAIGRKRADERDALMSHDLVGEKQSGRPPRPAAPSTPPQRGMSCRGQAQALCSIPLPWRGTPKAGGGLPRAAEEGAAKAMPLSKGSRRLAP